MRKGERDEELSQRPALLMVPTDASHNKSLSRANSNFFNSSLKTDSTHLLATSLGSRCCCCVSFSQLVKQFSSSITLFIRVGSLHHRCVSTQPASQPSKHCTGRPVTEAPPGSLLCLMMLLVVSLLMMGKVSPLEAAIGFNGLCVAAVLLL